MIYAFLAQGFEEIEAVSPIDLLRRAGKKIVTVGVDGQIIEGSHGIPVTADITDSQITLDDDLEMIILPGGMPGTLNLEKNENVQKAIDFCWENNRYIAAICAAPSILGHKGILDGKNAVCYPGFEEQLSGAKVLTEPVVADHKIITSRGAGAAVKFGLKLVEVLVSKEESEKLARSIIF